MKQNEIEKDIRSYLAGEIMVKDLAKRHKIAYPKIKEMINRHIEKRQLDKINNKEMLKDKDFEDLHFDSPMEKRMSRDAEMLTTLRNKTSEEIKRIIRGELADERGRRESAKPSTISWEQVQKSRLFRK